MNRKKFLFACGSACVSSVVLSSILQSCGTTKIIHATLNGSDLVVPLADFEEIKNQVKTYKKYIVAQNVSLQDPICIFRRDESNYTAISMKCSHQGVELQVFGDKLHCPAHGSEFNNEGMVQEGPAIENLRKFATRIENQELRISLKV